ADAAALAAHGISTVTDPYLEIGAVANIDGATRMFSALAQAEAAGPADAADNSSAPTWLIVTSTNALDYFEALLEPKQLKHLISNSKNLRFAAIGELTARQLSDRGATDIVTARSQYPNAPIDSESLADILCATNPGTAVIPSGSIAMVGLAQRLRAAGFEVVTEVVYETKKVDAPPSSVQKIASGQIDSVLLRSPSAARAFVDFNGVFTGVRFFCAGRTTAQQAERLGLKVAAIAPDPSPQAVAQTIANFLATNQDGAAHD
ncbi:MAG: uroporphyrinogen-III synthase, partial [Micrococcales bacterium]